MQLSYVLLHTLNSFRQPSVMVFPATQSGSSVEWPVIQRYLRVSETVKKPLLMCFVRTPAFKDCCSIEDVSRLIDESISKNIVIFMHNDHTFPVPHSLPCLWQLLNSPLSVG